MKQLLCKHRYRFHPGHSEIHPVIQLLNSCAFATISQPHQKTLSIFCDLGKALDVLQHDILLSKLINPAIRGKAHTWLKDYLSNRTQYVAINQTNSGIQTIHCGVPQGSILVLLLYLIHVTDIHSATTALSLPS